MVARNIFGTEEHKCFFRYLAIAIAIENHQRQKLCNARFAHSPDVSLCSFDFTWQIVVLSISHSVLKYTLDWIRHHANKKTAAATNVVEPLRRNGMQSAQNWIVYSKNWIMNYALWCYICSSIVWLWVCMFFCSTNLATTQWPDIGIDLITTLSMEQCARLVLRPYCYHKYKINTQHPRARACTEIWWMENPSRMLPLSHEMNGRVNWIASPVSARPKCEATIVLCCEFFFCCRYRRMLQNEEMKSTLIYGIHSQKQLHRSKSKLILALSTNRVVVTMAFAQTENPFFALKRSYSPPSSHKNRAIFE